MERRPEQDGQAVRVSCCARAVVGREATFDAGGQSVEDGPTRRLLEAVRGAWPKIGSIRFEQDPILARVSHTKPAIGLAARDERLEWIAARSVRASD